MKVCAEPGCPTLTTSRYCPTHQRQFEKRRPGRHQRGYDARWWRTRRAYLASHPCCEHPGCLAIATQVDHIDGLGPRTARGHDPANLRALCATHHSQRTARDQRAGTAAWRTSA